MNGRGRTRTRLRNCPRNIQGRAPAARLSIDETDVDVMNPVRRLREWITLRMNSLRGPAYWAARVARLERGSAPAIEAHLRTVPGVLSAWVTPSIDGRGLISVSYDPAVVTPESIAHACTPLAHGLAPVAHAEHRMASPDDSCIC